MTTLFSLAEGIRRCTACPLYKSRTLAVPGVGPSDAKIMLIGEAPGEEENRQGLPFIGRSGAMLDEMLTISNLPRDHIFITSICKCHPPKNRLPTRKESKTCKELWLLKQIDLIKPKLIILLGKTALDTMLKGYTLTHDHGKIIRENDQEYFITYHPSAARRFPKIKQLMISDFQKLKK